MRSMDSMEILSRADSEHIVIDLNTSKFKSRPWFAQRTVKLSFYNNVNGTALSIDQLSLKSDDGAELLKNGDFRDGMDHWFFTTDNHLPWHFKNLWLQIYFEQGALGLLFYATMMVYTSVVLLKRLRTQSLSMSGLAAALVGFMTVGVVDSLFDVPRMALLFYLLVALIILRERYISGRSLGP